MDIYNYLKKNQPNAFSIFQKALKNDSFFHAYLFVGSPGTPLLETAKFLAKSILQNKKTFYKQDPTLEKQIENNSLSNYLLIDGRVSNNIKIDEIRNIGVTFSTTSTDVVSKKVYIINLVEKMRNNVANTLLKFLEEPPSDTYAFFTSENEFKVLPTIKSRTQIIKFHTFNKDALIQQIKDESKITFLDIYLLSYFGCDSDNYIEMSKDENYLLARKAAITFINYLPDPNKLYLNMEIEFISQKKELKTARYFFDMLYFFFKEALTLKLTKETFFHDEYIKILDRIIENINDLNKAILLLVNLMEELNYNININLLITHLITEIIKL